MILSKCPIRVSLVGGSSDLQAYLDKYDIGSVISFPANLYTYITLKSIKHGYRISYSSVEYVNDPKEIKNDIAREVILELNLPPVEISFNSDISSSGSGLASSSSYLISLLGAAMYFLNKPITQYELCKMALMIERRFNPLTGYQDVYGCGLGSLKRLNFYKNGDVEIKYLDPSLINELEMYLVPTNGIRSSTNILSTIDIDKCTSLIDSVNLLEKSIINKEEFFSIINSSWENKKKTSPLIMNESCIEVENYIKSQPSTRAFRLCGAGGGGYFLVFTNIKCCNFDKIGYNIKIDNNGVKVNHV